MLVMVMAALATAAPDGSVTVRRMVASWAKALSGEDYEEGCEENGKAGAAASHSQGETPGKHGREGCHSWSLRSKRGRQNKKLG